MSRSIVGFKGRLIWVEISISLGYKLGICAVVYVALFGMVISVPIEFGVQTNFPELVFICANHISQFFHDVCKHILTTDILISGVIIAAYAVSSSELPRGGVRCF